MGSRVAVRVSSVPFFHMWDGFFFCIQTGNTGRRSLGHNGYLYENIFLNVHSWYKKKPEWGAECWKLKENIQHVCTLLSIHSITSS